MAAPSVLLAALLRLPRSSPTSFSHHQPSRCPFFACLRVAAGNGRIYWFCPPLRSGQPPAGGRPTFVALHSVVLLLEKVSKTLRSAPHIAAKCLRASVSFCTTLAPHAGGTRSLSGGLCTVALHTSASQPFGRRRFFLQSVSERKLQSIRKIMFGLPSARDRSPAI